MFDRLSRTLRSPDAEESRIGKEMTPLSILAQRWMERGACPGPGLRRGKLRPG